MSLEQRIEELKKNPKAMDALGKSAGISSQQRTVQLFDSTSKTVMAQIHEQAVTTHGLERLMAAAAALTWVEREHPEQILLSGDENRVAEVSRNTLDEALDQTVKHLASEENIGLKFASRFVETTTSCVLACLAGEPTQAVKEESFLPVGYKPKKAASAAPLASAAASAAASPSAPKVEPSDNLAAAGSSGRYFAIGGALVALLALGGYFALSGGTDDRSELVAAADSANSETASTTIPEALSEVDVPEPTASNEPTESDETSSSDAPAQPELVSLSVPMTDIVGTSGDAEGVLSFDFNTTTGEVCYEIESINIDGPYRSHIHVGTSDESGGIVVDLGPQEPGATGCVDNLPVDTAAILADPAGHYAELHDVTEEFTIRGQLSEAINNSGSDQPGPSLVDTDGGGASILLSDGTIYLEGIVPTEQVANELMESLSAVTGTPIVKNLEIVDGAPLPSGRVVIADAVLFDVGSATVKEIDAEILGAIVAIAESRPEWIVTIVGHTDDAGSDVSNLELSLERATALRDLLAAEGLADDRLRIRGSGERDPIGDNATSEGRAQNRRIEFEFTPN